eukprot:jgi/Chlat1/4731/Chrsp30S04752
MADAAAASVAVVTDQASGLPKLTLQHASGASAKVFLHGAHLTAWTTPAGDEIIFTSKEAVFKPPKAIRGGIPVCFPQFSDLGSLKAQHGFARNRSWNVASHSGDSAVLSLQPTVEDLQAWPHSQAQVHGLKGLTYLDNLEKRQQKSESSNFLIFDREASAQTFALVDRIYLNAPNTIVIADGGNKRSITITKSNLPDAVVWNPWIDKAKATADLGDEEYKVFLCVEAGAIGTPIVLKAGEEWEGSQTFTCE